MVSGLIADRLSGSINFAGGKLLDSRIGSHYNAGMLDKIIESIPHKAGSYLLWLNLPKAQELAVGRLGVFCFSPGDYLYLGSAQGSGGLQARLGRHLRGEGRTHWHIDYLRAAAVVSGFGYQIVPADSSNRLECRWSQNLAALAESTIPAPGFGSSDCRTSCLAHLVHFPSGLQDDFAQITVKTGLHLRIIYVLPGHQL